MDSRVVQSDQVHENDEQHPDNIVSQQGLNHILNQEFLLYLKAPSLALFETIFSLSNFGCSDTWRRTPP